VKESLDRFNYFRLLSFAVKSFHGIVITVLCFIYFIPFSPGYFRLFFSLAFEQLRFQKKKNTAIISSAELLLCILYLKPDLKYVAEKYELRDFT